MSVITVTDVTYRKFSGYEEPALPTGFHNTAGASTGDLTGGINVVQFNFASASGLFNSQYYSLEQVMVNEIATGGSIIGLSIVNFDGLQPNVYSLTLVGNEFSRSNLEFRSMPKLFLGQQQSVSTVACISFIVTNVDTVAIQVHIQGYIWSARSTSVPGGPQRPANGLYPA